MKLTKWMAATALFLSFGVAGCTDDITDEVSQLTRNTDEVSVAYNKDATAQISVRVPGAWSASVACKDAAGQETAAWLRLDPAEGVGNGKDYQWITAIADRNLGGEREAVITIVGATRGDAVEVKVTQDDGTFTVKKPVLSGDLKANVASNALLAVEYDKAKGGEPVEMTFTFDGDDRGLAIKDYTGTIEGEGSGKIELPITGTPSDIGVVKLNMKMTIEGKTIFDDVISLNIQSENFIFSMDFGKFVWGGDLMAAAGGEGEVLFDPHRGGGAHHRVLEHAADECRALVLGQVRDVGAVDDDLAGVDKERAGGGVEHRGLARAVAADDGDEVAVVQRQTQAVQRGLGVDGAGVKGLIKFLEFKHGRCLRSLRSGAAPCGGTSCSSSRGWRERPPRSAP